MMNRMFRSFVLFCTSRRMALVAAFGLMVLAVPALHAGRPVVAGLLAYCGAVTLFLVVHHGICRMNKACDAHGATLEREEK